LPIQYTQDIHDCFLSERRPTIPSCMCSSAVAPPSNTVC